MSGVTSGDAGSSSVTLVRLVVIGALAVLVPLGIGVAIAYSKPGHTWSVSGFLPFVAIWLALAALAAAAASLAGAEPLAIGAMTGLAFAIGSVVRDGSALGALIAIVAGLFGGWLAQQQGTQARGPRRSLLSLLIVAVVLGTPIGVFARVSPGEAAQASVGGHVLGVTVTHFRGDYSGAYGSVFVGSKKHPFDGGVVVGIRPRGIGSWLAEETTPIPEGCRLPDGITGASEVDGFARQAPNDGSVLVSAVDIMRNSFIVSRHVVVGVAPPGTTKIEGTSKTGAKVPLTLSPSGAYLIDQGEFSAVPELTRIAFRDARGTLLDSRAIGFPGRSHLDIAELSGLISTRPSRERTPFHSVVVSSYVITPAEYRALCQSEPPYGEGLVTIGIVSRDDGVTREVVIGSGEPLSSDHPAPDPPYVHPSGNEPCFFRR